MYTTTKIEWATHLTKIYQIYQGSTYLFEALS